MKLLAVVEGSRDSVKLFLQFQVHEDSSVFREHVVERP